MSFVGSAQQQAAPTGPDAVQQQQQTRRSNYYGPNAQGGAPGSKNVGAYQGGLQTQFRGYSGQTGGYGSTSNDPDVVARQSLENEDNNARNGMDEGVDFGHNAALENMYSTRIGLKNNLSDEINSAPGLLNQAQDQNKLVAGEALGQGLKNTRENFNSRGLLYSGAREGGEQSVQSAGASQLARSMAGTAQDSANSTNTAKAAYAAVDLANQQDTLNRANQAFDTANQNNIARLQAMQQLGSGVGKAAGTIAGSYSSPTPNSPPVSSDGSYNYNPNAGNMYQGLLSQGAHF